MIMRFRPANISLINRRHYLPRLLLILSSKGQIQKPPKRFEDIDRVTPYQGKLGGRFRSTANVPPGAEGDRCFNSVYLKITDQLPASLTTA